MRILVIPSAYAPVLGGLETVAHAISQQLLRTGHEVEVVTNRYPRSLPPREVLDGVRIYRWLFLKPNAGYLLRKRADLFLASLYFYPCTSLRLLNLVNRYRPDVVNVHFPDAQTPFVLWLRRQFRFRLVVSLHGHEVDRWFTESGRASAGPFVGAPESADRFPMRDKASRYARQSVAPLQRILREADAVTAPSEYLLHRAGELEPSVVDKGHVIYNGIDPERFLDQASYQCPRPYILAFGRLTDAKGFDLLLEAFARVAGERRDLTLILAGEGGERPALVAQAQRLDLTGQVKFFGRASRDEVVKLLNGSLGVVVPSRRESFGMAALEALAAGKPVLATNVGGLAEFLTAISSRHGVNGSPPARDDSAACAPNHGFPVPLSGYVSLVQPTVDGLAKGLRDWLAADHTNHRGIVGKTLKEAILGDYSWTQVARRYEAVLRG